MSDPVAPAAEAATDQAPAAPPTDQAPAAEKTFTQSDVDAIVAERVKRAEAKYKDHADLKAKAAKLDQIEAANASDLDRAVAKATADTRAAAAREFGEKTARGVFAARLEAAGRKPAEVAKLLDTINCAKFVDESGEVDLAGITEATALLAVSTQSQVDIGQGARGGAPTLDQQIEAARKAKNMSEVVRLETTKIFSLPKPS